MQMPWWIGKHGQHIKFGFMVINIIMNRCLKLVSPPAFNIMLYGWWKVFILQVKKYHYIDFWISSIGLHYTCLSLRAHLKLTLNTAHLFVELTKVPIKQFSTTGCRFTRNMLHLVVLCPRYIKIKYVPQQCYYDTSFKVWSDPKTTMPAKMAGCILTYAFPHHEDKYHELFNI